MRRIQCETPTCDGVFAHLLGGKTIDIGRQKQHFTIVGSDYSVMGTCGKCGNKCTLFVEDNKLVDADVKFLDDGVLSDDDKAKLEADKLRQAGDDLETEDKGLKGVKPDEEVELDADGKPVPKVPEITLQMIQKPGTVPAPRAA